MMIPWMLVGPALGVALAALEVRDCVRRWRADGLDTGDIVETSSVAGLMLSIGMGSMLDPVASVAFVALAIPADVGVRRLRQWRRLRRRPTAESLPGPPPPEAEERPPGT